MLITQLKVITEIPFDFSQKYQTVPRPNHRATVYFFMHESAIGDHDQWLPRCRSNIGSGNEMVGSFLFVLNSMALYSIWNMLCNLLSE